MENNATLKNIAFSIPERMEIADTVLIANCIISGC